MYATTLAKTIYSNPGQPVRTARDTEFDLFARITRSLKQAATADKRHFPALAAAIYENRRLWTALAVDVADEENLLPDELRARILYLNKFTQAHSREVLAGEANTDILVEINTAIMRGLRQAGGTA